MSAKEEFVLENSKMDKYFLLPYDYQCKFINVLLKHAPPDLVVSPSSMRVVPVHAPRTLVGKVSQQGPFILQPAPVELKDSSGGDATDIAYLTLGSAFVGDNEDLLAFVIPPCMHGCCSNFMLRSPSHVLLQVILQTITTIGHLSRSPKVHNREQMRMAEGI